MPVLSKDEKKREAHIKGVRAAKAAQHGSNLKIPVCKRCYEQHRRCPGPEVDHKGEWDFRKKCLRCAKSCNVVCDFHGPKCRIAKYKLQEMTEEEREEAMALSSQGKKRRSPAKSHFSNIQRPSKAQRRNDQACGTNQYLTHSMNQLPGPSSANLQPSATQSLEAQQPLFVQPTFLHSFKGKDEDDQISQEIRNLFKEEPGVADDVLRIANISQRPLVPNAHRLVRNGIVLAQHIDALRQSSLEVAASRLQQPQPDHEPPSRPSASVYPDPTMSQLTLTSPITRPSGFLYDSPYAKVERDWEAEVKMYEVQRKEARQKEREAALATNPPIYPFASTSSQPPRSTGYGKSMGNGGVGTLSYLGINWDDGEKED